MPHATNRRHLQPFSKGVYGQLGSDQEYIEQRCQEEQAGWQREPSTYLLYTMNDSRVAADLSFSIRNMAAGNKKTKQN